MSAPLAALEEIIDTSGIAPRTALPEPDQVRLGQRSQRLVHLGQVRGPAVSQDEQHTQD